MNPWIRLYRASLYNPKTGRLSDRQHRVWHNCLLMANDKGALPKMCDMAYHMRMTAHEAEQIVCELVECGLVDIEGVGQARSFKMHDWADHQPNLRPHASEWRAIRERIFERDDYTCVYCGVRGVSLQCDHVHPIAHGGGHDDGNLVTSCEPCNRAKRSKIVSIEQWKAVRSGGGS